MLILSRRRRGKFSEADRALRLALSDAVLWGWWDGRFPWTIDAAAVGSWSDARGSSGYGPALTQGTAASKPTYADRVVTFDGSDDYLRASSVTGLGDDFWMVFVGVVPTKAGAAKQMLFASVAATANAAQLAITSSDTAQALARTATATKSYTANSAIQVWHARRKKISGDFTAGLRFGTGSETTGTATVATNTADRITLGASKDATPTQYADMGVRAILIGTGDYTTAMQNAVNQWAQVAHGASV